MAHHEAVNYGIPDRSYQESHHNAEHEELRMQMERYGMVGGAHGGIAVPGAGGMGGGMGM